MSGAPLILVQPPDHLEEVAEQLATDGWRLATWQTLPARPWRLDCARVACVGRIEDRRDAEGALLAAIRGAAVAVAACPGRPLVDRLVEDLRRLGHVELRRVEEDDPLRVISDDQRRLLEMLAAGHSLREIAEATSYSRRTITRRLTDVRQALGARTTAEALSLANGRLRRAGVLTADAPARRQ